MTLGMDEKVNLSAHVVAEARGTDLLNVFMTMHRVGYPKHARVNTSGGLTYVVTRNGDVAPSNPTLILNKDEATILANSLQNFLFGPGWNITPAQVQDLREELAEVRRENTAMRKGKKRVENELHDAQKELDRVREVQGRYDDVMSVIHAVNSKSTPLLRDCE